MTEEKLIDFGNEESCKNYLVTKFDDLFQGINNLYGKELMQELLRRMEKTIAVFHQDVKSLIKDLKPVEERTIISGFPKTVTTIPEKPAVVPQSGSVFTTEKNEWEQHLS